MPGWLAEICYEYLLDHDATVHLHQAEDTRRPAAHSSAAGTVLWQKMFQDEV